MKTPACIVQAFLSLCFFSLISYWLTPTQYGGILHGLPDISAHFEGKIGDTFVTHGRHNELAKAFGTR